jgi:hypothetical protein
VARVLHDRVAVCKHAWIAHVHNVGRGRRTAILHAGHLSLHGRVLHVHGWQAVCVALIVRMMCVQRSQALRLLLIDEGVNLSVALQI